MFDPPTAAPARVCPTCGQPAGAEVFCAHCGANLAKVDALPTREAWLARQRSSGDGQTDGRRRRRPTGLIIVCAIAAVFVVGMAVLLVAERSDTVVLNNKTASMQPTWKPGDHLVVNTEVYRSHSPKVGDAIVFHPPAGADATTTTTTTATATTTTCADADKPRAEACATPTAALSSEVLFKRIAAGPGDKLSIKAGQVYVNGRLRLDHAIVPCAGGTGCDFPSSITIPPGHWFMIGDNRGESYDSRFWGPVPTNAILGRVDSCGPFHLFCHAKG